MDREYHLDKFKCLDLDNLQQIYKKLKKQEERTDFVCALPVIGKIKYNTLILENQLWQVLGLYNSHSNTV